MPICKLNFAFLEFSNGSLVSFILFVFFYRVFFIAMSSFRNVLLLKFRGEMSNQAGGDSGSLVPFTSFLGHPCLSVNSGSCYIQIPTGFRGRREISLKQISFQANDMGVVYFMSVPVSVARASHMAAPATRDWVEPCALKSWNAERGIMAHNKGGIGRIWRNLESLLCITWRGCHAYQSPS